MADKKNPEAGNLGAPKNLAAGKPLDQSYCTAKASELLSLAERQSYVIRVVTTMTNGLTKCQHYASLHSAVKAEARARARGCEAVLALARVVPVGVIAPDELAILRGDVQ